MTGANTDEDVKDHDLPLGFRRDSAELRSTRLSFLLGGSGPLVVLFTAVRRPPPPGDRCSSRARRGHTVLAPDLGGTGRSRRAPGGYGKDDQAGDIRALIQHLGHGPQVWTRLGTVSRADQSVGVGLRPA